jgi:hypothetical protein
MIEALDLLDRKERFAAAVYAWLKKNNLLDECLMDIGWTVSGRNP